MRPFMSVSSDSHLSGPFPSFDAHSSQARLQLGHVHFPILVGVQLGEQILVRFGLISGALAVREEQLPCGLVHGWAETAHEATPAAGGSTVVRENSAGLPGGEVAEKSTYKRRFTHRTETLFAARSKRVGRSLVHFAREDLLFSCALRLYITDTPFSRNRTNCHWVWLLCGRRLREEPLKPASIGILRTVLLKLILVVLFFQTKLRFVVGFVCDAPHTHGYAYSHAAVLVPTVVSIARSPIHFRESYPQEFDRAWKT